MSILIDENNKVVVQGITGGYAQRQTRLMLDYGTKVVAGVSPGKGGQMANGVPVFDTVQEAVAATGANTGVLYVPAVAAMEAAIESIEAGLKVLMIATERIPLQDSMKIKWLARDAGAWVVGPNSPGVISPGKCLLGSAVPSVVTPGPVGVISRSGTLLMEIVRYLSKGGCGQSTCIGIGGDTVIGRNPVDYLRLFDGDPETKAVVLLGEIGGLKEYEAAEFIRHMKKPVIAFIVGRFVPLGRRMGHVGAIVRGDRDTAESKRRALREAGAFVADTPWEIVELTRKVLD